MGKSSLMVRTAMRLREEQASVAVLDLTAIGLNVTPEQWYNGLMERLGIQLDREDELEAFWGENLHIGPLQRWMRALREVVLPNCAGRLVIFVDEIDAVRSLRFSTDEFFAGIREFYNRRPEDPELNRLTFCLLGVATPSDLIRDTRTTPFNIGQRIELTDFTELEAAPLATGLHRDGRVTTDLLKRILHWTGGHPYLTQRLCSEVVANPDVTRPAGVDRLCEALFFSTRAKEKDDNLLFVRDRLLRSDTDLATLLELYKQVRTHQRIRDDETDFFVSVLRLSGITRVVEGYLSVRNRIYYRVFDKEWVSAHMPDAEKKRQRQAYRRGTINTSIGVGVAAILATIFFMTKLLPIQANIFASHGVELPLFLRINAQLYRYFEEWWFVVLALTIAAAILIRKKKIPVPAFIANGVVPAIVAGLLVVNVFAATTMELVQVLIAYPNEIYLTQQSHYVGVIKGLTALREAQLSFRSKQQKGGFTCDRAVLNRELDRDLVQPLTGIGYEVHLAGCNIIPARHYEVSVIPNSYSFNRIVFCSDESGVIAYSDATGDRPPPAQVCLEKLRKLR
jgi:hypothetical protein